MKKIMLIALAVLGFTAARAQTDSLQEYTGKYKFPDGSVVTEVNISVESGVLSASSVMGSTELKKTDTKDVFDIVAYSGVATFKRNTEGKLTGLRIQVQDIDMEGTKSEGGSGILSRSMAFPENRR